MADISLIIITKNAEKTLADTLNSVQGLVSEIVLVDDFSTDKTLEIARKFNAKTSQHALKSFGEQKQIALDQAQNDWVLLLDSDETAPAELVQEIKNLVNSPKKHAPAYGIHRKNHYFGKWLKYGGKYPDTQIRLLQKKSVRFSKDIIHEKLVVQGAAGVLRNPLLHFTYPDLDTWLAKLKLFAEFRAEKLLKSGEKPSAFGAIYRAILIPKFRFCRRYIFKGGFLDGWEGFLAQLHDFLTEVLTYFIFVRKYKSK